MILSTVTSKGQVTISEAIREELGIDPGDEIEFVETERGYTIEKQVAENPFEKWRGVADIDEGVTERMADLRGDRE